MLNIDSFFAKSVSRLRRTMGWDDSGVYIWDPLEGDEEIDYFGELIYIPLMDLLTL